MQLLNQWGPWLLVLFVVIYGWVKIEHMLEERLGRIEDGIRELRDHFIDDDES